MTPFQDKNSKAFLMPSSLSAQESSAANRPQRSIFRRFLTQYLDIGMRNRQKLSSLGSIFASDDLSPTGYKQPFTSLFF